MKSELIGILLFFSYGVLLLSFPNFGPISLKVIETSGVNSYELFSMFYLSHILGIGISAIFLDRVVKRISLLKVLVPFIVLFSFLIPLYYQLISVLGLLMGVFVVIMGSYLARFVEPWKRGKVFAIGASLANVYFYILFNAFELTNLYIMMILSIIPLLLVYLIPEIDFERRESNMNWDIMYFSLPVFVFYFVSGIMYGMMEKAFREAGITTHVVFYIIFVLIAGYIYDRFGRRSVAVIGLLLLSSSILLFPSKLLYSAYLIQSSYSFIDVFSMVIWADISGYGSEARHYALGMLFITVPIYLGFLFTTFFTFQINSLVAILLLILSALLVSSAKEPLMSPEEYMRWLSR